MKTKEKILAILDFVVGLVWAAIAIFTYGDISLLGTICYCIIAFLSFVTALYLAHYIDKNKPLD